MYAILARQRGQLRRRASLTKAIPSHLATSTSFACPAGLNNGVIGNVDTSVGLDGNVNTTLNVLRTYVNMFLLQRPVQCNRPSGFGVPLNNWHRGRRGVQSNGLHGGL